MSTHRPFATLGCHVTEDGHRHTGAVGVDEVHAVFLIALGVDVITVQGLLKTGLLQSCKWQCEDREEKED